MKIIATNKSASFEYFIEDKYEAGIVLEGNEIKSIRAGAVNMNDSFCFIRGNTVSVKNMHVALYDKSDAFSSKDTRRDRKLLLTSRELAKLSRASQDSGLTIVGLRLFLNERGLAKVAIGLARGRKSYDKREYLKANDAKREMDQAMKRYK